MIPTKQFILAMLGATLAACSLSPKLPEEPPALADMEEPLALRQEPPDEAARQGLPAGCFSGLYLVDGRDTLAAKLDEPGMLVVERVVENSPAERADLRVGDIVIEATIGGGQPIEVHRPSEWRKLELDAAPGSEVELLIDRAGLELERRLTLVARHRPAQRDTTEQYREEQRVGVVVRTATEVEARAAGLGPGAGAVLIGMSASSPWRKVDLRFGDLLVAIDERPLAHPQDLLNALRQPERDELRLDYVRDGARHTVVAALSHRDSDVNEISLPLVFYYGTERGHFEWSALLGLFNYRSTAAAWRFRLFWLIGFGGGDADRLVEIGS